MPVTTPSTVLKGNSTRMRQDAKTYLALVMERMMARIPDDQSLPELSPDENRAVGALLNIYQATVDEFQAQNPLLMENILATTSEDLPKLFAKAKRVLG